jgi:hypothetical protein
MNDARQEFTPEPSTQFLRLRALVALACLVVVPVIAGAAAASDAGHRKRCAARQPACGSRRGSSAADFRMASVLPSRRGQRAGRRAVRLALAGGYITICVVNHRFLTVVVDHDTGRLLWAAPGRDRATLRTFFELLGPERCTAISHVSADPDRRDCRRMLPGRGAIRRPVPRGRVATEALDEVRRHALNEARASYSAPAPDRSPPGRPPTATAESPAAPRSSRRIWRSTNPRPASCGASSPTGRWDHDPRDLPATQHRPRSAADRKGDQGYSTMHLGWCRGAGIADSCVGPRTWR